jgi:hypothetical protein
MPILHTLATILAQCYERIRTITSGFGHHSFPQCLHRFEVAALIDSKLTVRIAITMALRPVMILTDKKLFY